MHQNTPTVASPDSSDSIKQEQPGQQLLSIFCIKQHAHQLVKTRWAIGMNIYEREPSCDCIKQGLSRGFLTLLPSLCKSVQASQLTLKHLISSLNFTGMVQSRCSTRHTRCMIEDFSAPVGNSTQTRHAFPPSNSTLIHLF